MNYLCSAFTYIGLDYCNHGELATAVPENIQKLFHQYVAEQGKSYATKEEYNFRLNLFAQKHQEIAEISQTNGGSFTLGHNLFSDWTKDEYRRLLGYKQQKSGIIGGDGHDSYVYLDTANLTDAVDWRTKGAVNPVKNQGQCGSCWAFSATCAIEGRNFVKNGELLDLAEQQFVDCDTTSAGCNGGW